MFKLSFYVPVECKEKVKEALFNVGAGKIGRYDQCCFEVQGRGQFRAKAGANPTLGEVNELCHVDEVKIEMVVADEKIAESLRALIKSHPYEEPAYDVVKCLEIPF
jgi:hypothetical protein